MGKFKKGLFLGGMLGAGMTWLMATKKGKEVREQMLDHAADVYSKLRIQLLKNENYDKLTKHRYVTLLREYVDKYAIENGLANEVKEMIIKVVSAQWKNLRGELKKK
jgi:gas vesicle protein